MGEARRFVVPRQGGSSRGCSGAEPGPPPVAGAADPPGAEAADAGVPPVDGRFRQLFEQVPMGVALSSLDGRFTEVNPWLRELLAGTGIDPDHAGLADLARHLPDGSDEASRWRDGLAEVLAGRAPVARAELEIAAPGTPPRWVRATTALVVLGEDRCLVSHVEDVGGAVPPHGAESRTDESRTDGSRTDGSRTDGSRTVEPRTAAGCRAPYATAPRPAGRCSPAGIPGRWTRAVAVLGAVARGVRAMFLVKHRPPRLLAGRDAAVPRPGRRS